MKKLLAFIMAIVMCLSSVACGGDSEAKTPSSGNTSNPGTIRTDANDKKKNLL